MQRKTSRLHWEKNNSRCVCVCLLKSNDSSFISLFMSLVTLLKKGNWFCVKQFFIFLQFNSKVETWLTLAHFFPLSLKCVSDKKKKLCASSSNCSENIDISSRFLFDGQLHTHRKENNRRRASRLHSLCRACYINLIKYRLHTLPISDWSSSRGQRSNNRGSKSSSNRSWSIWAN